MDAGTSTEELRPAADDDELEYQIFRQYYTDKDYFSSPEGVLKVLSSVVCVVSAALFLGWATCPGVPALAPSAAGVSLASGAASALLCTAVALHLPLRSPQNYILIDIIVSTMMGVLLLIMAVLSMAACKFYSVISYMHGPLAMLNAGLVTSSAVTTYAAVMRLQDAARPRCHHSAATSDEPAEHDV